MTWDQDADGYRLPTDAEWQVACRAGTTGARYGRLDDIAWYEGNSDGHIHPVQTKSANSWGLFDLLGGVWEWCWAFTIQKSMGRTALSAAADGAIRNGVVEQACDARPARLRPLMISVSALLEALPDSPPLRCLNRDPLVDRIHVLRGAAGEPRTLPRCKRIDRQQQHCIGHQK